jgi:hypothetical protein
VPQLLQPPTEGLPTGSEALIIAQNEYRKIFIQIIGGIAILYGLYLTGRRTKALEDTARISEEGQITERFTKAVEQLGSDKREVRLGGIYALERIAGDSEKDHWSVMEVLTAYVREHAKLDEREKPSKDMKNKKTESKFSDDTYARKLFTTDVQAALTVIGRRKWSERDDKKNRYLDLERTNLPKADFVEANLKGVTLRYANLSEAFFRGANLQDG